MKKTFEMVVKGKTTMPLPEPVDGIIRKSEKYRAGLFGSLLTLIQV